jgi:quinol monooxygenase YgiN
MIANFVKFPVKPGRMKDFIEVSLANSRGSINGPGCYATSIFADPSGASLAYVFEVFADQQAFDDHHAQPYYTQWLAAIKDLLDGDYQMLQNTAFPSEESFRRLREAVAAP